LARERITGFEPALPDPESGPQVSGLEPMLGGDRRKKPIDVVLYFQGEADEAEREGNTVRARVIRQLRSQVTLLTFDLKDRLPGLENGPNDNVALLACRQEYEHRRTLRDLARKHGDAQAEAEHDKAARIVREYITFWERRLRGEDG
jgi:hypothetical protein